MANTLSEKALANLLKAAGQVLDFDWCDNDEDAVDAIEELRQAVADYHTVRRLSDNSGAGE